MGNRELKPCPFCGGEAEYKRVGNPRQSEIVGCTDCHCTLESSDQDHYSGSSWNTRATPDNVRKTRKLILNLIEVNSNANRKEPSSFIYCHDVNTMLDNILLSLGEPEVQSDNVREALEVTEREIGVIDKIISENLGNINPYVYKNSLTKIKSLLEAG